MCTVLVASTIIEVLDEKCKNQDVFTAFEVTKEARIKTSDTVLHKDVRGIVNNEFITSQMQNYDRELCVLDMSGNPQALVYFPDGKSASEHSLVSDNTSVVIDDDNTDSTVNDPDVYTLTAKGRINIPKKLVDKISSVAGSYDIFVNGDLKSTTPNKDGRVRLSLKKLGISDSKVKITVDDNSDTISIETI